MAKELHFNTDGSAIRKLQVCYSITLKKWFFFFFLASMFLVICLCFTEWCEQACWFGWCYSWS
jgi:hypothetical protein